MDAEDYRDHFKDNEDVKSNLPSFPPLPQRPFLADRRDTCTFDISTGNQEISSFLDLVLAESVSEMTDFQGQIDKDTATTGPQDDAKEKKVPTVSDTEEKHTHKASFHRRTRGPLAATTILNECLTAPATTNWNNVINLRVEILRREHHKSQVNDQTGQGSVVQENIQIDQGSSNNEEGTEIMNQIPDKDNDVKSTTSIPGNGSTNKDGTANIQEVSEEDGGEAVEEDGDNAAKEAGDEVVDEDGDKAEIDLCKDSSVEYLEESSPLQVFYPPYPSDINLPVPLPEVKVKMVRLSRTVTDILFRRTTPYMPPTEKTGPKIWNTFQKVSKTDVYPNEDKPMKKSFFQRLITFFRKKSSKVSPTSS